VKVLIAINVEKVVIFYIYLLLYHIYYRVVKEINTLKLKGILIVERELNT
jgi:hypothetical protein